MNWRTDKPTADVIVAKIDDGYEVLKLSNGYYSNSDYVVRPEAIKKWADLEEDETVTDCNELEEEIERIVKCEKEFMNFKFKSQLISYIARHFAKWGAEHLVDDSKKVVDTAQEPQGLDEAAEKAYPDEKVILARGNTCLSCGKVKRGAFKAGANWQAQHSLTWKDMQFIWQLCDTLNDEHPNLCSSREFFGEVLKRFLESKI